jgi:hypothetical protein
VEFSGDVGWRMNFCDGRVMVGVMGTCGRGKDCKKIVSRTKRFKLLSSDTNFDV